MENLKVQTKAEELIKKFKRYEIDKDDVFFDMDDDYEDTISAIYNAITCVDELVLVVDMCIPYHNEETYVDFWKKVKQTLTDKLKS